MKKVWLRQGLNQQLSWLTIVCLGGFDRNVPTVIAAVPCLSSTPVPSTRCKERREAAIN